MYGTRQHPAMLLLPLLIRTEHGVRAQQQAQRCTFSSCTEACQPCPSSDPKITFCPSDPNGAQCSSRGGTWTKKGGGLCENQARPYGEEVRTKVPPAFTSTWGPDKGPGGEDRGYGWRYCSGGSASAEFTRECEDFARVWATVWLLQLGGAAFHTVRAVGGSEEPIAATRKAIRAYSSTISCDRWWICVF
jgi:hypothetical protein